jgi:hypothetical protein
VLFQKKSEQRYEKLFCFASNDPMSLPEPFGWRTAWIAVRTAETELLAPELQLVNLRSCEWEEGLRETSDKGIFICPPVSGWTLIVGLSLPDASNENTLPLIVRLSDAHHSAQYFGNHRVVEYYAWAKAERGRLVRAYAFLGDQGATPWDRGELTLEEHELGLTFDDALPANHGDPHETALEMLQRMKHNPPKFPKEHDVFALARKWSIDPTQIEEYEVSQSHGLLGYQELLL